MQITGHKPHVLSVLVMRPQCLHEILSVPLHLYVRSRQNVILQVMKVRQRPRNNGTERFITYYIIYIIFACSI